MRPAGSGIRGWITDCEAMYLTGVECRRGVGPITALVIETLRKLAMEVATMVPPVRGRPGSWRSYMFNLGLSHENIERDAIAK